MWRVLVLIRQKPRQLSELARMLSVSERTIRRDLEALARIPLPVATRYPLGDGSRRGVPLADWQPNEWYLEPFDAWPPCEPLPVADIPGVVEA